MSVFFTGENSKNHGRHSIRCCYVSAVRGTSSAFQPLPSFHLFGAFIDLESTEIGQAPSGTRFSMQEAAPLNWRRHSKTPSQLSIFKAADMPSSIVGEMGGVKIVVFLEIIHSEQVHADLSKKNFKHAKNCTDMVQCKGENVTIGIGFQSFPSQEHDGPLTVISVHYEQNVINGVQQRDDLSSALLEYFLKRSLHH